MPQPSDSKKTQLNTTFTPTKPVNVRERAIICRSMIIKGEFSGTESLYIEGRIEGSVDFAGHCVTIGRDGSVAANINAREVVILGKLQGNIQCTDWYTSPAKARSAGTWSLGVSALRTEPP